MDSSTSRDIVVFSIVRDSACAECGGRSASAWPTRLRASGRAAERRGELDQRYVSEFAERLGDAFPGCPAAERQAIADHACRKYSGRVGRSAAASRFDPDVLELAARAHVRHRHTRYDELLTRGIDRGDARAEVRGAVDEIIARWKAPPA